MPADLFGSSTPALAVGRRKSVLPLSIAAHVVGLGAVFVVTLVSETELPLPQRAMPEYVRLVMPGMPAEPAPPRPASSTTSSAPNPNAAPIEAPSEILPETGLEPIPHHAASSFGAPEGGVPWGEPGGLGAGVALPPAPPPPPSGPVRVGGDIRPPRRIHDVRPDYPRIALQARVEGTVELDAVIDTDGRVTQVTVLSGHPLLTDAATDAVRQWRFTPTLLNSQPVPIIMSVKVDFRLR